MAGGPGTALSVYGCSAIFVFSKLLQRRPKWPIALTLEIGQKERRTTHGRHY